MSNLTDLAAQIDAMTLDELLGREDLPTAGGVADTKRGWSKRMGAHVTSRAFQDAWAKLEAAGLVERIKGQAAGGARRASLTLYRCPALAEKLK